MTAPRKATIYGARGSLPNTSKETRKFGGATTCLSLELSEKALIVIDAGTGIADLSHRLMTDTEGPREIHLLMTHTHWDHILGFPFLLPIYDPEWTLHLYSLKRAAKTLHEIFSSIYTFRYFPGPFGALNADFVFHDISFQDEFQIGDATVNCCRMNHPGYALGFRISWGDRVLFFASDSAPFTDLLFEDRYHERKREKNPQTLTSMGKFDENLRNQLRGADILFYDSNFTDEEYEAMFHFGHSSMRQAYDLALDCNVKHLVLWHHDRKRTDDQLESLSAPLIEAGKAKGLTVDVAQVFREYPL
ncbi:MAG: MBL fold metallo-hydrolase [Planctomycetota bacterium]|jgi:phosphoribosyl 1,2-cyclic phosphodiesterase